MSIAYKEINETWIVGAVRTPIGRHGGTLSSVRPDDLGALVLEALVERTGVPPEEVEDVYMGCANQTGEDNRNVGEMDSEDERLNPNGGAIALGHPLGCSGGRILTRLVHEMGRRPEVRYGLATMCIGVGQGMAMVVESGSHP